MADVGGATTVYAALGAPFGCTANGIYKSTDNGQSWTRLHGFDAVAGTTLVDPTSGTTNVGRIALATAPSNPSVVYAAVEVADPGRRDDGTRQGVYESTDGGTTWVALARPNDLGFNDQLANQYWYDLYVAVDPIDPSTVYLGGIDVWKGVTTNAGTAWTNLTNSYANANDNYQPGPGHPDQHALVFAPGGLMYAGINGNNTYQGNPPKVKYSPRVGAVYSLDAKTVIRGGYGLYYQKTAYSNFTPLVSTGPISKAVLS